MDLEKSLPEGRYTLNISGQGEFTCAYAGMDSLGIHVFVRPMDEEVSIMRSTKAFPHALTPVDERSFKVGASGTMDHHAGDDEFKKYKQKWEASADDGE